LTLGRLARAFQSRREIGHAAPDLLRVHGRETELQTFPLGRGVSLEVAAERVDLHVARRRSAGWSVRKAREGPG